MPGLSDSYCAGFFDGEGTVYAATRRSTGKSGRKSPTITVCMTNTDKNVIDLHQSKWGGSVYKRVQGSTICTIGSDA